MDLKQVKKYWVEPALEYFPPKLLTPNRTQFMVAIGLVESGYNYVAQVPDAEALGFWQMENFTFHDCIDNFLSYESQFSEGWTNLQNTHTILYSALAYDCVLACYMTAIKIYRAPPELPAYNDIEGMAKYWKTYYNTSEGAGTIERAVQVMQEVIDL